MRTGVFTAQPLLLDGPGFALFGPEHLLWLAICAAWITVALWLFHRFDGDSRRQTRYLRVVASIPLMLLASEDGLMIATGTFTSPWWPLHFCNFAEYICFLYALHPNRACRELLLTLGLSGGCMAMTFPGWGYCPAYTWPVICGFLEHATIFAVSVMALSNPRELPRWRDMPISLVFVAVYVIFFRWFNAAMGSNFGFVTYPAEGSPLELWAKQLGNPGYLVPYGTLYVIACIVMHAVCEWKRRRALKGEA